MKEGAIQSQARAVADGVAAVVDAVQRGEPADQALAAIFRAHREYGSRDRRLLGAATFSYFRWKGWLAGYASLPEALAAAYYLDAASRHPAIDLLAPRDVEPVGALGLDGKARAVATWLGADAPLSVDALVPAWTARELVDAEQPDVLRAFIAAIQTRPPLWLRARSTRTKAVLAALHDADATAAADARMPQALRVDGTLQIEQLHRKTAGAFEVQDIASQTVGLACHPRRGEHWWDVCAGAGGKTLHLADLMEDRGELVASDIRAGALRELRRRVRQAGFACVADIVELPADPGEWKIDRTFDGILVDAPCSGLGTWGRAPDARWRTQEQDLAVFAERQVALLRSASRFVKPGGRLVYAVCSLTRSETLHVCDKFRDVAPSAKPAPLPNPLAGRAVGDGLALYPHDGPGIGMFMASYSM